MSDCKRESFYKKSYGIKSMGITISADDRIRHHIGIDKKNLKCKKFPLYKKFLFDSIIDVGAIASAIIE